MGNKYLYIFKSSHFPFDSTRMHVVPPWTQVCFLSVDFFSVLPQIRALIQDVSHHKAEDPLQKER